MGWGGVRSGSILAGKSVYSLVGWDELPMEGKQTLLMGMGMLEAALSGAVSSLLSPGTIRQSDSAWNGMSRS